VLLPQPRSPLFPYTTLFRSGDAARVRPERFTSWAGETASWRESYPVGYTAPSESALMPQEVIRRIGEIAGPEAVYAAGVGQHQRSEEHTSELQSRFDLVCRL